MEQPLGPRVDFDSFLRRLADSETKLEFLDGLIFSFAGGTVAHADLCSRLNALVRASAAAGCRTFSADMALTVSTAGAYVFPDIMYTCEPVDADATAVAAPSILMEVLSPESVRRDRIEKLDLYQSIESLQEYVIVDSRLRHVVVFRRIDAAWRQQSFAAADDLIELTAVPLRVRMADLYDGIR